MRIAYGLMVSLSFTISASILREKTIAAINHTKIFPTALCGLIVSYLEGGGKLVLRGTFEIPKVSIFTLQRIDTYVACGDNRGNIYFLDINSVKVMHKFEGHSGEIISLASLPGSRFASGAADETIRIWNTVTHQCLHILKHHQRTTCLAAHGNNLLVAFAHIGFVRLWDIDTGECIKECGIGGRVLCSLPSGNLLASSICEKVLREWTTHNLRDNNGPRVETEIKCEHEIRSIALSSQGKLALKVGLHTHSIVEIWDNNHKKYIRTLKLGDDDQNRFIKVSNKIQEVAWLADEQIVIVGVTGKLVRYANDTGRIIQKIRGRGCLPCTLRYRGIVCVGNSLIINDGSGGFTIFDRDVDIRHAAIRKIL
jgi:WD40 repeat protein